MSNPSRFHLVPFTAEHYLAIPPRKEEAAVADYKPLLVDRLLRSTVALTLMDDQTPIVCGGLWLFWPGMGEIWFHGSDASTQHAVAVFRNSRRLVQSWIKEYSIYRLQLTIDESFQASYRFAEALGFTLESRMPRYGPNQETFLRYVLLP
jgi:hypothetical protein